MLTCITCKQKVEDDGGEEGIRGSPNTKNSVKTLTAQIKDIALKVSGAYRCKSSMPTNSYKKGHGPYPYPDFDAISEGVLYNYQTGSSNSTPAWDFTSNGHLQTPARTDSRLSDVMLEDEDEAKEWTAQVEPGIQITFGSLPHGGNDLKRIRFRYLFTISYFPIPFNLYGSVLQGVEFKKERKILNTKSDVPLELVIFNKL
ncbi:hypothetical protein HAX54_035773 [Datura stramonium]|uniref:BRX domain-containing protein n=1 Tax=Datura stramonium TaxID=4076 RepID=A0ABS8RM12_DATST|nr:hypothetical protein [Datura stramonium]